MKIYWFSGYYKNDYGICKEYRGYVFADSYNQAKEKAMTGIKYTDLYIEERECILIDEYR